MGIFDIQYILYDYLLFKVFADVFNILIFLSELRVI